MTAVSDGLGPRRAALLEVKNYALLIVTLLLIVIYVLRHTGVLFGTAVDVVNSVVVCGVVVLAMLVAGVSRVTWVVNVVIAVLAVLIAGAGVVSGSELWTSIGNLLGGYLLLYSTFLVLRVTVARRRVTGDTLFGALAVYLSLGIIFGIVYTTISRHYPEAFEPAQVISGGRTELYYFSFVTLTTVGFGDISPVYDSVQILATLEAVLGVVLLAALVGRIVGLLVVQQASSD